MADEKRLTDKEMAEIEKRVEADLRPKMEAALKKQLTQGAEAEIEKRVRAKIETTLMRFLTDVAPSLDHALETISKVIGTDDARLGEVARIHQGTVLTATGKMTWAGLIASIGVMTIGKKLLARRKPDGSFDGWVAKGIEVLQNNYTAKAI